MTQDLSTYLIFGFITLAILVILSSILANYNVRGKIWKVIRYGFLFSISYLIVVGIIDYNYFSHSSSLYIHAENPRELIILVNNNLLDSNDINYSESDFHFDLYGNQSINTIEIIKNNSTLFKGDIDNGVWGINLINFQDLIVEELLYGNHSIEEQNQLYYYKSQCEYDKVKVTDDFDAVIYTFHREPPKMITKRVRGRGKGIGKAIISLFVREKAAKNKIETTRYFSIKSKTCSSSYTPSTEQYNNYQPSTTQEKYDENPVELNSSTTAYGSFSIGSDKSEVLRIQGNPTSTMKLDVLNKEIWSYGNSSVTFSYGKVSEYSDFDNNLKVQYSDGNEESQSDNFSRSRNFSIGSDKSEVLRIQGNPTSTMKLDVLNKEIWSYGNSSVTFSYGKVSEYSDFDNNLKVQYSDGNEESQSDNFSRSRNFSIGSDKSEVLRIQGNPTSTMKLDVLNKEIWSYGNSSVTFSYGKVSEYSDFDNNLKVQY